LWAWVAFPSSLGLHWREIQGAKPLNAAPKLRRFQYSLWSLFVVMTLACIMMSWLGANIANERKANRARTKVARAECQELANTIEMFKMDQGTYPPNLVVLVGLMGEPYLTKLPIDPWGQPYQYQYDSKKPRIWSFGPDRLPNTDDDIDNYH
jgi:general secretion pathway protein G